MRPEHRHTRSAALRGALGITVIALIATSLALSLQYVQTTRLLAARTHAQVDDEMAALVERYRDTGLDGVAQAIARQQTIPRIHEFFYLLTQADGAPIAGNLVAWPSEVKDVGFHTFATDVTNTRSATSRRSVEARAIVLEGGFRLLVGDFADEAGVLRDNYVSALAWSLLSTGIVGLLLGWWYARRGLAFVETVSAAGERFLGGRFDERLPVSARGDEYDRLAETINRSFGEIERLVSSLRAATDGMAHDLKTPLTRMKARLELAEMRDLQNPVERKTILDDTRRDLDALLRLIDGLLSVARADATSTTSFRNTALDEIVADALELFGPLAEDKTIELISRQSPVVIMGSPTLLAQLVTNLLDNAIKHTPSGGRIVVSLSGPLAPMLTVADSGPGIPADQREAALARFRQMGEVHPGSGAGLGLSIVDAVARAHGARLRLSDNAPGLRVEVQFPRLNR
jgi:signal transduction histidine kinase